MLKKHHFFMTLIAAAVLSGCNSVAHNSSLAEAHGSYNNARSSTQVTDLAAVELQQAGDTLTRADHALSQGESASTVNQLAYVASQQVAIAVETSRRKAAELEVSKASARRDQVRLEARTAEADAARQQVADMQVTADQQTADLSAASANAQTSQILLDVIAADADSANAQVADMQVTASKQTAALAAANANAQQDQASIEAKTAEADAARQQVSDMQVTADQQAAALLDASARSQRDQAQIATQDGQLKELHAMKTARGMVITLGDVLFSINKAELIPGGLRDMNKLAEFLKQYPNQKVLVEGYTDSTGNSSLNQDLSDQRASAVRTALLDAGISSDRVAMHGYGEAFPVSGNDTAAGRQLNRRVEIILSDSDGNIAARR